MQCIARAYATKGKLKLSPEQVGLGSEGFNTRGGLTVARRLRFHCFAPQEMTARALAQAAQLQTTASRHGAIFFRQLLTETIELPAREISEVAAIEAD